MGLFDRFKKSDISTRVSHIDGIPFFMQGFMVETSIDDELECINIKPLVEKKESVKIKFNQIIDVDVVTDKEIIEKSKSVLGRAVVGNLVLGPLGAIVGGMSGIGNKKKSKLSHYIVLNYKSTLEDEVKVISFEIVGGSLKWDKFVKELRDRINTKDSIEKEIPEYL